MQCQVLKVIVGPVGLEHIEPGIGYQRKGILPLVVGGQGLLEIFLVVAADRDNVQPHRLEIFDPGSKGAQLFSAMDTAVAQVEDDADRPALVPGQAQLCALVILQLPGRGLRRLPAKRTEGAQVRSNSYIGRLLVFPPPVALMSQLKGNRSEPLKYRGLKIELP